MSYNKLCVTMIDDDDDDATDTFVGSPVSVVSALSVLIL